MKKLLPAILALAALAFLGTTSSRAALLPGTGAAVGAAAAADSLTQDVRLLHRHCVRYRHHRHWGRWHCGRWH